MACAKIPLGQKPSDLFVALPTPTFVPKGWSPFINRNLLRLRTLRRSPLVVRRSCSPFRPFHSASRRLLRSLLSPRGSTMATFRNLKIKTATCKRILKELRSYEKEVEREVAKTAEMKENGADPYDLKQQENVLAESRMMVPDCHRRLEASLADLKGILVELKDSNQQAAEIEEAEKMIAEVEASFQTTE